MPPSDEIRDAPGKYIVRHDTLREFNAILQRDATDTTYKYAFLRALVEIAEQESHHVKDQEDGCVNFPLGLVVERWMYFSYLFVARDIRHFEAFLRDNLMVMPMIRETHSMIAVTEIEDTTELPLETQL